jgi:hypothetical protein
MPQAVIEHHAGTATVKADIVDPLMYAITAVSREYGWVVHYEDPPFAGTDLTVYSPRPGVPPYQVVAGGAFESTYPETPHMWSSRATELEVLQRIVADYNASGNPGKFTVLELPDGNFDVVGVSTHDRSGAIIPITPILDTRISIPSAPRTFHDTLQAIFAALPVKVTGGCPHCPPMGGTITVGGSKVSARDLLIQVVDSLGRNWLWGITYNAGPPPRYMLGIGLAKRVEYDTFGKQHLVPVEPGR